ncbi:Anaphase promoting complex subunit 7 [Thoreauomyces humboldtii]|nr:Anaphase promoting complex subunit 7 [Thoreauomyces humboldtii]
MTFAQEHEGILASAQQLLDNHLNESAELLLGYLLSTIPPTHNDPETLSVYSKASALLGDACVAGGQDNRALGLYCTAYRILNNHGRKDSLEERKFLSTLKERQALCYSRLGLLKEAIDEAERIPVADASVKVLMKLAGWYEERMLLKQAKEAYINILRKEPLATEAMMGAIRYGVEFDDLIRCFPATAAGTWTKDYIWSYFAARKHRYVDALQKLERLEKLTPLPNCDVLLSQADCHYKSGDLLKSHTAFRKVLKRDTTVVKHMDRYAILLAKRGQRGALEQNANALSKRNPKRKESWLAMACSRREQGDLPTALSFVQKALDLDAKYAEAWLMKGELLVSSGKIQDAIPMFRVALAYDESLAAYEGVLTCYLTQERLAEAHELTANIGARMSGLPNALILMGSVLQASGGPEGHKSARGMFEQAYKSNPRCTAAVLALVTACEKDGDDQLAVQLLKEHAGDIQLATLHCRMAEIFFRHAKHEEAMEQFSTALQIDRNFEPAAKGLKKLNKMLESDPMTLLADSDDDDGDDMLSNEY